MISEFFDLEQKLADQLALLKKEFGLCAVKAEFEAEGSSFRDLLRLRRLTAQQNIPLCLKIGKVEALRDLKDALDRWNAFRKFGGNPIEILYYLAKSLIGLAFPSTNYFKR